MMDLEVDFDHYCKSPNGAVAASLTGTLFLSDEPTTFNNYDVLLEREEQKGVIVPLELEVWDTAGESRQPLNPATALSIFFSVPFCACPRKERN